MLDGHRPVPYLAVAARRRAARRSHHAATRDHRAVRVRPCGRDHRGGRGGGRARAARPQRRHLDLRARDLSRSEEHTSELQSLMRISYAVFCLKKTINIAERKVESHEPRKKTSLKP